MKLKRIVSSSVFLLMFSVLLCGQAEMKPGYVITENGMRIECQVRDAGDGATPTDVTYQPQGIFSKVRIGTVEDVREFAIDTVRFLRAEVKPGLLEPEKTVFLKELSTGTPSLYQYSDGTAETFYTSTDGIEFTPLMPGNTGTLNNLLGVDLLKGINLGSLIFNAKNLKSIFDKLGGKKAPTSIFSSTSNKKTSTRKIISMPGIYAVGNIGTAQSYSAGLEVYYPLPSNPKKFSVGLEASYFHYSVKPADVEEAATDVKGLRVPLSLRYHINLLGKTKPYAAVFAGLDLPFGGTASPALFYGAGAGVTRGNFRLGIRYAPDSKAVSLDLGCRLF